MGVAVAEIVSYPVKSCAGISLDRAAITAEGVEYDRSFVIVDEDGTFLSQRAHPRLATIRPAVRAAGSGAEPDTLGLSAPDAGTLEIPVIRTGPTRPITVQSWSGHGIDQGAQVAEWLTAVLGVPARLMGESAAMQRSRPGRYPNSVRFPDAYPLLVASAASLDELNARIGERGGQPVPMDRFRPNIVLTGWGEAHTEDRVDRLALGEVELGFERQCVRCSIPLVEQDTGRPDGPEPIRTLAGYRRSADGGVTFASNYSVLRPGTLALGDTVTVHSWLDEADSGSEEARSGSEEALSGLEETRTGSEEPDSRSGEAARPS